MFDFFKKNKKKETTKQPSNSQVAETLYAPATGEFKSIDQVDDPVFSQKMMGDGYAVEPESGEVYAPVAGTVMSIFPTKHAIYIKTDDDVEVLVHMGIDTVELDGAPFEVTVSEGDQVKVGSQLAIVDLAKLESAGKGKSIVVVFTNLDDFSNLQLTASGQVSQSAEVGSVTSNN
ncbi:PTS glucose transporter subunit IIA [Aerococcaceae bacterium 50-4]